jgi:hypothetical protein
MQLEAQNEVETFDICDLEYDVAGVGAEEASVSDEMHRPQNRWTFG